MKTRAIFLSLLLTLATGLPLLAQDDNNQEKTPSDQSQNDQSQNDKTKKQAKHDGGKDDVDAIGNRKVGGVDWYSLEKEVRIGKEYSMQIEQSMRMVTDPVVNEYINRIGQNLVRNSDAKVPFTS